MSNVDSMRSISASAALALSVAMKSQIANRSLSACGFLNGLFAMLGRQPLSSFRFDPLEHIADFLGGTAVKSLLNFSAQRFELGLAALLALLDQPQTITQDFTRRRISAAFDQALDELLEMPSNAVT